MVSLIGIQKMIDDFDMISAHKQFTENVKQPEQIVSKQKYTPFDFMSAVSETKQDLIKNDVDPEATEKLYNGYIVNRGFSYHADTILHANEMNMRHELFKSAQFYYYLGILKSRKRYSKWHKLEKDEELDAIQEYYQCNRQIAKQYYSVLTPENRAYINKKVSHKHENR